MFLGGAGAELNTLLAEERLATRIPVDNESFPSRWYGSVHLWGYSRTSPMAGPLRTRQKGTASRVQPVESPRKFRSSEKYSIARLQSARD